jgi:conjugative transfer region protein (TIGR03750 family)
MQKERQRLVAEHLNAEPLLFRGCTYSELGLIAVLSVLVWLPLSLLIAGMIGKLSMGLGVTTLGVIGTVYMLANLLQRVKRGHPEGYYQQRLAMWLHDRGLRDSGYIRRTGGWSIGRSVRRR